MEIITIQFDEKLMIQIDNQLVTLLSKKNINLGDVSFGINAPPSISVNREEIYHLKKRQRQVLNKEKD